MSAAAESQPGGDGGATPRRLIVGYDGSPNAEDALVLGGALARALEVEPVVVTALPQLAHLLRSDDLEQAVEEMSEPIFRQARERLGDVDVTTRAIVDPSAGRGLYELADAVKPVAIVVGSCHRGTIGRVLLGSVGMVLLSGAPCPIAVAPRGYATEVGAGHLGQVAAAFSGEPEAWVALEAASGLAAKLDARLTVLGAVETVHYGYAAPYPMLDAGSYFEDRKRDMDAALERAVERVPAGVPTERRLLTGDPAQVIAESAADFDLLVVGSRGYGPLRRALLGSVSARLLNEAPCPVLVLPRGVGDDPLGVRERAGASSEGAT